ncbi:hypothetical protein D3C81_1008270 [compost metagenome]
MKVNKIDGGVFLIDEFLTRGEEECINLQLKGSVWRYNWPSYEGLPLVRPCWHFFIAGKGRPDRKSCLGKSSGKLLAARKSPQASDCLWAFLCLFCRELYVRVDPCGSGLAKTVGQSASMLNVSPYSRASPLPHWFSGGQGTRGASAQATHPCPATSD